MTSSSSGRLPITAHHIETWWWSELSSSCDFDDARRDLLSTQHRDATGVAVLATFLEDDPIWLLSEQLDPRGDAVAAALRVEHEDGRQGLVTTDFIRWS